MNTKTIKEISEKIAEEAAIEFKEKIDTYTEELLQTTKNTEPIIKDVEFGNITFQHTNPYTIFVDVTFRLDGETFQIEEDNYQFGKGLDYISKTINDVNINYLDNEIISNCSISEIKYIGLDTHNPSRNFYMDKFKNKPIVDVNIILTTEIADYIYKDNNWGEQIEKTINDLYDKLYARISITG